MNFRLYLCEIIIVVNVEWRDIKGEILILKIILCNIKELYDGKSCLGNEKIIVFKYGVNFGLSW